MPVKKIQWIRLLPAQPAFPPLFQLLFKPIVPLPVDVMATAVQIPGVLLPVIV